MQYYHFCRPIFRYSMCHSTVSKPCIHS
jgi:hypothetical protein